MRSKHYVLISIKIANFHEHAANVLTTLSWEAFMLGIETQVLDEASQRFVTRFEQNIHFLITASPERGHWFASMGWTPF